MTQWSQIVRTIASKHLVIVCKLTLDWHGCWTITVGYFAYQIFPLVLGSLLHARENRHVLVSPTLMFGPMRPLPIVKPIMWGLLSRVKWTLNAHFQLKWAFSKSSQEPTTRMIPVNVYIYIYIHHLNQRVVISTNFLAPTAPSCHPPRWRFYRQYDNPSVSYMYI